MASLLKIYLAISRRSENETAKRCQDLAKICSRFLGDDEEDTRCHTLSQSYTANQYWVPRLPSDVVFLQELLPFFRLHFQELVLEGAGERYDGGTWIVLVHPLLDLY